MHEYYHRNEQPLRHRNKMKICGKSTIAALEKKKYAFNTDKHSGLAVLLRP